MKKFLYGLVIAMSTLTSACVPTRASIRFSVFPHGHMRHYCNHSCHHYGVYPHGHYLHSCWRGCAYHGYCRHGLFGTACHYCGGRVRITIR